MTDRVRGPAGEGPARERPPSRERLPASGWVLGTGVALALVVAAAVAALLYKDWLDTLTSQRSRVELIARVLEDHATRSIEATSLATTTLAEIAGSGEDAGGPAVAAALRQTLVNLAFLRAIAVIDADGRVLAASTASDGGDRRDPARRGPLPAPGLDSIGPFTAGRDLRDLRRGAGTLAAASSPPGLGFIPFVRTLQGPDGRRLHIVALLNPGAFSAFQTLTLNDPLGAAALTTYEGTVLASTPTAGLASAQSVADRAPFVQFLPRLEHGVWVGPGLRPQSQVAAFRVLRNRPVTVMAEVALAPLVASWWQRSLTFVVTSAAGVLFVLLATVVAARSLRAREMVRADLDRAQAGVAARERELSLIFRSVQEVLFRTDARGTLSFINRRWDPIGQRSTSEVIGRPLHEIVAPQSDVAVRALFDPAGPEGARRTQACMVGVDGVQRWFDVAVVPIVEDGAVVAYAGSAMEITGIRAAQQALQAQLAYTESLIESSPLPIAVLDAAGRHLRVNRAWEAFTGLQRAGIDGLVASASGLPDVARGNTLPEPAPLPTPDMARGGWRALTADGRYEARHLRADGSLRDLLVNRTLVPSADGQPQPIVLTFLDISEFREAERATREARDAAEAASLAKSEFMANVSHELRTPLQSILGFSELGRRRAREQPAYAEMFGDIHDAGRRMLALVNDLLDLARTESTELSMNFAFLDVRALVREVTAEQRTQALARAVEVAVALSPKPLVAAVDALRLQQVLRNILANAIRFSPEGGRIDVEGDVGAHGRVVLKVSDRGPGVPEEELERIFDAFVQSTRTKDGSGGTGLGLAISRRIMAAHGGTVRASLRDGGGSVFTVELPAAGSQIP
ncbi:MAG: ATP-binding protein [Rubrivivax sp.]